MGIYLDKLRSTLNDVQSKHITNLLHKQKNSGEIANLEQFRTRLTELTEQILADKIEPSLEVFFNDFDEVIDSTSYNYMIDRIRDDLESIYSEINTLDEISDAHNNIINNVVLNALKFGISELENKVSLYEFLANNENGFSKSLFNTFAASQEGRTYRTDGDTGILFQDPRSKQIVNNDVTVDTVGERITLGIDTISPIPIRGISQIFDSEATQSEDMVAFESANILNVIDGAKGTYWTYSILQKQINPEGITAKFELDLGANVDLNFLEIESASVYPMQLIRIEYVNANGTTANINVFETLVNRTVKISFAKINARKLNIVVQQLNALEVQYENKNTSDNWDLIMSKQDAAPNMDSVAKEIRENILSSKLLETGFMISNDPTPGTPVKYFDYTIGFDNIRAGYAEFASDSIFVSSTLEIDNLQQLGLKAKELRPINNGTVGFTDQTNPSIAELGSAVFLGSLEYNAILQNYNDKDQLVDINIIPLLPVGVEYVSHEKLLLTAKVGVSNVNNVGILRFYTQHFEESIDDIKVYRNGTLLTIDTDWVIEAYPYTNDFVPPNGLPNTVGIRILNPGNDNYFTVSYPPMLSTTRAHPVNLDTIDLEFDSGFAVPYGMQVVDLVGDASATMNLDNIVCISAQKHNGQSVAYTKINLAITLRRNSTNLYLSPAVEEYTLLVHNGE